MEYLTFKCRLNNGFLELVNLNDDKEILTIFGSGFKAGQNYLSKDFQAIEVKYRCYGKDKLVYRMHSEFRVVHISKKDVYATGKLIYTANPDVFCIIG